MAAKDTLITDGIGLAMFQHAFEFFGGFNCLTSSLVIRLKVGFAVRRDALPAGSCSKGGGGL